MNRKRALLITILVLLVASVITASIILSGKHTTTPNPPTSLGTNAEGFEISPIKAGEGGTTLGPDGTTSIGYPPTCEGAYTAAINFHKADQTINANWSKTRETLIYIAADPQQINSSIQNTDDMVNDHGAQDYAVANIQTLGIFKPVSCEAGKSARVVVSVVTLAKFPNSSPYLVIKASPVEVFWRNGDWKLSPVNDPREGESMNLQLQTNTVPEITPEIVNALFTTKDGEAISRDGWMVVSNATR